MKDNDYLHRSYLTITQAIQTLSHHFDNIGIPIKPCVEYDLFVEKTSKFSLVKVICTTSKAPSGSYVANLRKSGGYNKANTRKTPFDCKCCDYLYIKTPHGEYLIPSKDIPNGRQISLSQYAKYKLGA